MLCRYNRFKLALHIRDSLLTLLRLRREAVLTDLGKTAEIYLYEGAGHAFANPSGTRYNPEAAELSWERTTAFLAEHLQQ